MKKNTMIYIIITILACALTGTITYMFVNNKDNKSEIKENKNNSNHQNNNEENNSNQNNKEEEITLSSTELENYLKYIPFDIDGKVYRKEFSNIQNIDKNLLLDNLITNIVNDGEYDFNNNKKIKHNKELLCNEKSNYFVDYCPNDEQFLPTQYYIPLSYINIKSKKMYNKELTGFQNTQISDEALNIKGVSYYYQDGNFISTPYGSGGENNVERVNLLDTYELTDKELIIYEYVAYYFLDFDGIGNVWTIGDYYNNYKISINDADLEFNNYLKENKTKFTKYKHTFKKGTNGYYWYSTEVVK